jgi:hypothetical protein
MSNAVRPKRERRLTGTHLTVIAVAALAVLIPSTAYAVTGQLVNVADPWNDTAVARVSTDGRLGVRGEVAAQPAVPAHEWHFSSEWSNGGPSHPTLLTVAPRGASISIGQITLTAQNVNASVVVRVYPEPDSDRGCRSAVNYFPRNFILRTGTPMFPIQRTYPVPWTFEPPDLSRRTCLIAFRADISNDGEDAGRHFWIEANGLVGTPSPDFAPPKNAG